MVYRLILSYRGDAYAGWQRQENAVAVQQVVEEALARLLSRSVTLVGASRTDAGVHARRQVAHFDLASPFSLDGLALGTNHHLPPDIRVLAAHRMPDGFHARKCALAKEYRYRMSRERVLCPLDAPFTVQVDPGIDLERMVEANRLMIGRHDFSAFAKSGGGHGQPFRTIFHAQWEERGPELRLRVVGDGFLRGMVRALVGTLIEVGSRKLSAEEFGALLSGRTRSEAGPTAPARGLILERVLYPPQWE